MLDKLNVKLVKTLIDNTPVAYIVLDEDYRIHFINEKFLKLRNLNKDLILGEKCYNISNGGVPCRQCAVKRALETGERAFVSRKDILPDNTVRFIDDYAIPLENVSGGKRYVLEIMVDRSKEKLLQQQREEDYKRILASLSNLIEAKDSYTYKHSESVRLLAVKLAHAMGLSPTDVEEISFAASLHDIGKMQVPKSIINKPDKLTDEEFNIIKAHPVTAYEMLSGLANFQMAQQIARHHHERVDGRGYPDGLSGDDIPLGAKIVAVADTYDAITSTRSYRQAHSHEYALAEIARVAGAQLDKDVAEAFLNMDFDMNVNLDPDDSAATKPLERSLPKQDTPTKPQRAAADDFISEVGEEQLLHEILANTPCGYAFMDKSRKVWFASEYFLDYMGLRDADILQHPCYATGDSQSIACRDCAVVKALQSGNVEYMRQERSFGGDLKIFDLFGVPLKNEDDAVEYVIQIIIDRTQEVLAARGRDQDFDKLVDMLSELLNVSNDTSEEKLTAEILALQESLNKLRKKQA